MRSFLGIFIVFKYFAIKNTDLIASQKIYGFLRIIPDFLCKQMTTNIFSKTLEKNYGKAFLAV
jgi:hypothetical protein